MTGEQPVGDEFHIAGTTRRLTVARVGQKPDRSEQAFSGLMLAEGREADRTRFMRIAFPVTVGGTFGLLVLMRALHVVSREPLWLYLAIPGAIAVFAVAAPSWIVAHPTRRQRLIQMVGTSLSTVVVVYLTGWGPILITAFAVNAVVVIILYGSALWKVGVAIDCTLVVAAQVGIGLHLVPSKLPALDAAGIAVLAVFVYLVIVRLTVFAAEEISAAAERLESSEERFRSLVQHVSDTTMLISADGQQVVYVSPACEQLLGCPPEALIGMDLLGMVHPDDLEKVATEVAGRLGTEEVINSEFRMSMVGGGAIVRDVEAVISDLRENPAVNGFVVNLRDITQRKAAEAQLAFSAFHDPLTGLANRTLILDRADQMLARSRRHRQESAILFIDLDDFKDVNDSLGHQAGDALLVEVATRLVASVRETDTVGRMGGDEFVVLLEGPFQGDEPERVADVLLSALQDPFLLGPGTTPMVVTASVGIATGSRETPYDLLRDADIALYQAKRAGKNRSALFAPAMQSAVVDRLLHETDLQRAVDSGEFFLEYQPLFDLESVSVYGIEALVRWHHPSRGVVPPDQFVPDLEASGLILDVGRWVLEKACRQLVDWAHQGHRLVMSINISAAHFDSDCLVGDVARAIAASDCDPTSLVIEITESTLMSDPAGGVARLRQLKDLGVRIALDDFGTGNSSLARLRKFSVDELKIDRTFISALLGSKEASIIIKSFIELGEALGIDTLAEGIEDRVQLEVLQSARCLRGQGFLVSEPLAAESISDFLSAWQPHGSAS